jgi:cytochrome b subunit of formate dehydrogenase
MVPGPTVERYRRAARWLHAAVYCAVLLLLATGWWFLLVGYGHESPLARLTGQPDATTHELTGQALVVVLLGWPVVRWRAAWSFVRETLYYRRGDGRWFATLPRAVFTGRFGHHDGHFDPGQRVANVVMAGTLAVLAGTGLGMLYLPGGGVLLAVHRWSVFALTPVVVGHVVVASGVLPGYRGVWRSMHLGGRLPVDVARRVWPGWLDRHADAAQHRGSR